MYYIPCILTYLLGTKYSSMTPLLRCIMWYSPIVSYSNPVINHLSKKKPTFPTLAQVYIPNRAFTPKYTWRRLWHLWRWHKFTSQIAHLHPIYYEKADTHGYFSHVTLLWKHPLYTLSMTQYHRKKNAPTDKSESRHLPIQKNPTNGFWVAQDPSFARCRSPSMLDFAPQKSAHSDIDPHPPPLATNPIVRFRRRDTASWLSLKRIFVNILNPLILCRPRRSKR